MGLEAAPLSSGGAGAPLGAGQAPVALLAVDLGLRLGLAFYGADGALLAYRSSHVGSTAQLRRAADHVLSGLPALQAVFAEGDRALFDIWARAAARRGLAARLVPAETWREALLLPRQQRTARLAKGAADRLARELIAASPARQPTSLRHDAAEAILLGFWAVQELGWRAPTRERPAVSRRS